jgi:hypothetical protein
MKLICCWISAPRLKARPSAPTAMPPPGRFKGLIRHFRPVLEQRIMDYKRKPCLMPCPAPRQQVSVNIRDYRGDVDFPAMVAFVAMQYEHERDAT